MHKSDARANAYAEHDSVETGFPQLLFFSVIDFKKDKIET